MGKAQKGGAKATGSAASASWLGSEEVVKLLRCVNSSRYSMWRRRAGARGAADALGWVGGASRASASPSCDAQAGGGSHKMACFLPAPAQASAAHARLLLCWRQYDANGAHSAQSRRVLCSWHGLGTSAYALVTEGLHQRRCSALTLCPSCPSLRRGRHDALALTKIALEAEPC